MRRSQHPLGITNWQRDTKGEVAKAKAITVTAA
jgi:hypothetical protein